MEEVFKYIIGLGAAVMMPVIFTILGVCIGIKLGDALKSGLKVGVGFIGLSIVTALLTSALGPALNTVVEIYDLQLKVFDMGRRPPLPTTPPWEPLSSPCVLASTC